MTYYADQRDRRITILKERFRQLDMTKAERDRQIAALQNELCQLGKITQHALDTVGKKRTEEESKAIREASDEAEHKQEELAALLRLEEEPLLADLKERGIIVDTIARLDTGHRYDELLPLLIQHLQRDYHDQIKAAIAFVIASSAARPYWAILRKEFEKEKSDKSFYNTALANALLHTATLTDVCEITDILESCPNSASLILLGVLRKYRKRSAEAEAAIRRFSSDPRYSKEINTWPKSRRPAGSPKLTPRSGGGN